MWIRGGGKTLIHKMWIICRFFFGTLPLDVKKFAWVSRLWLGGCSLTLTCRKEMGGTGCLGLLPVKLGRVCTAGNWGNTVGDIYIWPVLGVKGIGAKSFKEEKTTTNKVEASVGISLELMKTKPDLVLMLLLYFVSCPSLTEECSANLSLRGSFGLTAGRICLIPAYYLDRTEHCGLQLIYNISKNHL